VRFPGGRWSGNYEAPVSLVDLVPTLLDELGVELPDGVQGRSLMPLLRGEPGAPESFRDRLRVVSFADEETARYGQRWKFGFESFGDETRNELLFDLESDPGETHNLAQSAEEAGRLAELMSRYREWRSATATEDAAHYIALGEATLDEEEAAELGGLGYGGSTDD